MKKLLTFLTALFYLLSLCSCTQKPSEEPLPDESVTQAEVTAEGEVEKAFSSGKVENNVYHSEFSAITITPPNNKWEFADKGYLYSLMKIDENASELDKTDEALSKKATIYDALLSDNATGSNILVIYENLETTDNPEISELEQAKLVKEELVAAKDYTATEPYTVLLAAKKYTRLDYTAKIDNQTVDASYFIRKIDKYMLVICVTPAVKSDVTVADMLSFIS